MTTKTEKTKKSRPKPAQNKRPVERKRSTASAAARMRTRAGKRTVHPPRAKSATAVKTGRGAPSKGKAAAARPTKPAPKAKSTAKPAKVPPHKPTTPKRPQAEAKPAAPSVRAQVRPAKIRPKPPAPRPAPSHEPAAATSHVPAGRGGDRPANGGGHGGGSEFGGRGTASKGPGRDGRVLTNGAAKTVAAALRARVPTSEAIRRLSERPGATTDRESFSEGDFVVYPTHGVGRVVAIETQQIAGISLPLIVINFDKDRMTLRVPVAKAHNSGLRKLSSRKVMDTALATLKGRSRVKRTMWSRRAQEYEAKINSGDPVSIAEVVRDLHRGSDQPDQSYSERQIYQAALERLARELAAVERIDEQVAAQRLEEMLKAA